ncbi:MAG: MTH1187 family thiamine-binding protein [Thermoplasmata archaeon]|nr:MTH1187 family thiamine-binding protein [Thermoplasmata archaeon]
MIVAEVSIAPFGVGTSLSRYVKVAVASLRGSGLRVTPCPMGTVLEAQDLASIFRAVEKAHDAVREAGGQRISISLKVDARYDKDASAEEKMRSIGEL